MTDIHQPHEHHDPHDDHAGPSVNTYYIIAIALAVFTASSFVFNMMVTGKVFTPFLGFVFILGVAICKATLVGAYFMHIKYEWRKLYFMLVPAFILGTMMMIVLLPDIVLAWGPK